MPAMAQHDPAFQWETAALRESADRHRRLHLPTDDVTPGRSRPDNGPGDDETVDARTMIMPIDAWEKMLMQLGNLHEAGQQLAEARERAAKAETEAKFLRERLAELRNEATPGTGADPAVIDDASGQSDIGAGVDHPNAHPHPPDGTVRSRYRWIRAIRVYSAQRRDERRRRRT